MHLLQVFNHYPPLTMRLQYQVVFMHRMLLLTTTEVSKGATYSTYIRERGNKYEARQYAAPRNPEDILTVPYYREWLSGFIEAEGCFSIRASGRTFSFSISQKYGHDVLHAIRLYLRTVARVNLRNGAPEFYYLETYNRASLRKIIEHCACYPLLGEKALQLKAFTRFIAALPVCKD